MKLNTIHEDSLIVVISAPSGVGKTTIRKNIGLKDKNFAYSVSYTTRRPRAGEIEGLDYHFITQNSFRAKIQEEFFFEWAEVHQNFYGTPKELILSSLKEKRDILLDIDVQGARKLQSILKEAIFIFLLPPSWTILEQRLRNRETETEQQVQQRLITAKNEIQRCWEYDYVVINSQIEETVEKIYTIISAEHNRPFRMKGLIRENLKIS